uniref:Maf family protein n=1 Tax=Facilibium subflavum TaxID=2219058 RepID=UPI000E652F5B
KSSCTEVDIDESVHPGELAEDYLNRIIYKKLAAAKQKATKPYPILVADTAVVKNHHILGKPKDYQQFSEFMRLLSNTWHQVITSIGFSIGDQVHYEPVISDVLFDEITPKQMKDYWETKEPFDKAGGYAIQGLGAVFVKQIRGSYSAIMGLPVYEIYQLLTKYNLVKIHTTGH